MGNTKLEQKANETETMLLACGYCQRKLQVPKNFYSLRKNKEYDEFYRSPGGGPYCDKGHFNMFTED